METKFSELIRLFRCAVQEEACTTRIQSNIRDIMEEAGHQQIGTLIFPAVRSLYEAGQTDLSPEEFTCYEQVYTQVIMKEVQRQYALFQKPPSTYLEVNSFWNFTSSFSYMATPLVP